MTTIIARSRRTREDQRATPLLTSSRVKVLELRRPDACVVCRTALPAGTTAQWDPTRKVVTCLSCSGTTAPTPPRSVAGGSATAEAAARRARQAVRHEKLKRDRPVVGRLALRLFPERDAGKSYASGAIGEEAVGRMLDGLTGKGISVLHDLRIPGSKANIDHVAVTPSGVWVIDSKRYVNKHVRRAWGVLNVGGRDATKLLIGVRGQADRVDAALQRAGIVDVRVHAALCFVEADIGLLQRPFRVGDVLVTWRRALAKQLVRDGPLDEASRREVLSAIAAAFPSAT